MHAMTPAGCRAPHDAPAALDTAATQKRAHPPPAVWSLGWSCPAGITGDATTCQERCSVLFSPHLPTVSLKSFLNRAFGPRF